jgi:hypothetical protein
VQESLEPEPTRRAITEKIQHTHVLTMAISSDAPFTRETVVTADSNRTPENEAATATSNGDVNEMSTAPPKQSTDESPKSLDDIDSTADFEGDVNTNNDLPTQQTLKKIENLPILDSDGKTIPFKNLYTGPNVARRVLIIFIRHFFCGVCPAYPCSPFSQTITQKQSIPN